MVIKSYPYIDHCREQVVNTLGRSKERVPLKDSDAAKDQSSKG